MDFVGCCGERVIEAQRRIGFIRCKRIGKSFSGLDTSNPKCICAVCSCEFAGKDKKENLDQKEIKYIQGISSKLDFCDYCDNYFQVNDFGGCKCKFSGEKCNPKFNKISDFLGGDKK